MLRSLYYYNVIRLHIENPIKIKKPVLVDVLTEHLVKGKGKDKDTNSQVFYYYIEYI